MTLASRNPLPASAELIQRLGWLLRLRWLAIVGVLAFLEVARRAFAVAVGLWQLYATLLALALSNAAYSWWLARLRRAEHPPLPRWAARLARFLLPRSQLGAGDANGAARAALFANLQVAVDLLLLAALLHFSGGIENPFLYFFIFHVIIASILFSRRATYVHAGWGVVLVAATAIGECAGWLHHFSLGGAWFAGAYRDGSVVAAQIVVFALTLFLSAYMGGSIAARLRRREREVVVLGRELAEKAETLAEALDRATRAERAKSQYMRKVAHELRGPLGTIGTTMSALLGGVAGELPAPAKEMLGRVEARADALAQVTSDLLALARAREATATAEPVPVDLAAVCRSVVDDAEQEADRRGVAIRLEVAPGVTPLLGDATSLAELTGNLVSNSLRYTPAGGRVDVRLSRRQDALLLEVEDTGIGIPEDEQDKVFEEFFRAGNARARTSEGTGLGLAIVKAAVERHGGTVAVRSAVGLGTTITVRLPVAAADRLCAGAPRPA